MTVQLQDAINAIQAGNRERGRQLLAMLLQREPKNEAAWIWMSGTVEDAEQRRYCLEQALAINPANPTARAGLALLKGQEPELPPPVPPLARADHGLGQPPIPPDNAPRPTPAFVWEKEPEPGEEAPIVEDTFIGDIVAAMNKDEDGAGKAPDTDLNWLFPAESAESAQGSEAELRQMFGGLEQDLEPTEPEPPLAANEPLPLASQADQAAPDDETLGTFEPLLEQDFPGYEAATIPGLAALPGQMWQDLSGRSRWVTILTDRHLIYAKPDPRRIPEIEAVLPAGQFPHRMLGRGAKTIPLERINRVRALSGQATLQVSYRRKDDTRLQTFTLSNPEQRDEVLAEWQEGEDGPALHIFCHVSGGLAFGAAGMRDRIFRHELPLAIEALRMGDRGLFEARPELDRVPIWIHFQSTNRRYHKTERWGTPADYRL